MAAMGPEPEPESGPDDQSNEESDDESYVTRVRRRVRSKPKKKKFRYADQKTAAKFEKDMNDRYENIEKPNYFYENTAADDKIFITTGDREDELSKSIEPIQNALMQFDADLSTDEQKSAAKNLLTKLKDLATTKKLFYNQVLQQMDKKMVETLSLDNLEKESTIEPTELVAAAQKFNELVEQLINAISEEDMAVAANKGDDDKFDDFIDGEYTSRSKKKDEKLAEAKYLAQLAEADRVQKVKLDRLIRQTYGLSLPHWEGDQVSKDKSGKLMVFSNPMDPMSIEVNSWPLAEKISDNEVPVFDFKMTYAPALFYYRMQTLANLEEKEQKQLKASRKKKSAKIKNKHSKKQKAFRKKFNTVVVAVKEKMDMYTYENYLLKTRRQPGQVITPTFLQSSYNYLTAANEKFLNNFRKEIIMHINNSLNIEILQLVTPVLAVLNETKEAIDDALTRERDNIIDEIEIERAAAAQIIYSSEEDALSEDDASSDDKPLDWNDDNVLNFSEELEELMEKNQTIDGFVADEEDSDEEMALASDQESSAAASAQPAAKKRKTTKLKAVAKPSAKPVASAKGRIKRNMVKMNSTKKQQVQLRF